LPVSVVDVKTGQQVGNQFKVDANANGAFIKNLPWAWVSIRRSSPPCESRTAARSWWRPQPLHAPYKAEDAPDHTSQLLGLGLLLAADEFLVPARAGRTDPLTSAHQRPVAPRIPGAMARLREDRYSVGMSSGPPPSRCRGAWGRPWPPRRARWASFHFANDKRLEVLSGTNFVDLLKEPPGTAALPSSRHLIRPCWRCPLVLWLALPWGQLGGVP
jgi:hypothetical protein